MSCPARVEVVEYLGDEELVHVTLEGRSLQAKLPVEHPVQEREELVFFIPREKLYVFDAATEERVRS